MKLKKPRSSVRARLMGRTEPWVPYDPALARELVRRCRTMGQKAVVQVLLVQWQEQQRDREDPVWDVVAGARTIARELGADAKHVRALLGELVDRGVLEETGERAARDARVLRLAVRGSETPGQPVDHSDSVSDRGSLTPGNGTLPGVRDPRTDEASGGERPPDEGDVRGSLTPPSRRSSAPPFGRSRAELQKRERASPGPGLTQLRLRLFAAVPGRPPDPEAKELLALAESGGVDADWQRRAESVLGRLKGGEVEDAGSLGEVRRARAAGA